MRLDGRAIVSAIIALAKQLNLNIVAKGVENEAQKAFLLAQNCFIAQGFYYARAMPIKDFVSSMVNDVK